MKRYQVTGRMVALHGGIIGLSKEQAAPRKHRLKDLGNNRYQITGEVQFKQGEIIAYDADVSKALAVDLEEVERVKKSKEKAKAKATAAPPGDEDSLDAQARRQWDNDPKLREEYEDIFGEYLADLKGE